MKRAAVVACLCVVCGLAFYATGTAYLGRTLADAGVTNGDPSGAAVRLLYARTLAERSPLMALVGTDPDKLHEAIDRLSAVQELLVDMQTSDAAATHVRSLYPITFLRAAAELERARINFLADGSTASYAAYSRQLTDTVAVYESDLAAFTHAFDAAVPDDAPEYATADALISKNTMYQTLEALHDELQRVRREMYKRRACIAGVIILCSKRNLQVPTEIVSSENVIGRYAAADIYDAARSSQEVLRATLTRDACTAAFPGEPVYALIQLRDSSDLRPIFLGDMRLIDAEEQRTVPFYAFFAERDLRYVPSPPFTHYSCVRFSDAFSHLLALKAQSEDAPDHTPALMARNNSAHFDAVVRYVADLESAVIRASDEGAPGAFDPATLFYVRNAFAPLFLVNNRSLAAEDPLRFVPNDIPLSEQPYVFLSDMTYDPEMMETLVESQKLFDNIHAPLQL